MSLITDVKIASSLEKLYFNDKMPENSLNGFSMLKNEKKSFQILIETSKDINVDCVIETTIKDYNLYKVTDVKSTSTSFSTKNHASETLLNSCPVLLTIFATFNSSFSIDLYTS